MLVGLNGHFQCQHRTTQPNVSCNLFSLLAAINILFFLFPSSLCWRKREMECIISRERLIEDAKEELEILEYHHPNKFHSIKLDLKAFISQLHNSPPPSPSPCISAATQESSSINKKKRECPVVEEEEASNVKPPKKKSKCRTDAVLHRARLCLNKLQHLKTTFF